MPLLDLVYAASPYNFSALLGGKIGAEKHLSPAAKAMGEKRATLPIKVALAGADYFYSLARGYIWNLANIPGTVSLRRSPRRHIQPY